MFRTEHQSSIDAKKSYTRYKWTLNDWSLLCDHHYSNGISSPKFFLSNTGCECSMFLRKNGESWTLRIDSGRAMDWVLIKIIVSFDDKEINKEHQINKVLKKPFPKEFYVDLGRAITKDCIKNSMNDALILLIEFTIVESIDTCELQTENFNEKSTKNMNEILNSKSFCDCTFVIGGKEFIAHKIILAANSEVFRAMFSTKMKEEETNIVEIDDIEATVFEEFLNYIYSGKVNNLENIVSELIIVAEKYLMYDLKQLCSNYMVVHINIENAIQYLLVLHKLDCVIPKTKALNFIWANDRVLANTANRTILSDYPELIKEVFGNSFSKM